MRSAIQSSGLHFFTAAPQPSGQQYTALHIAAEATKLIPDAHINNKTEGAPRALEGVAPETMGCGNPPSPLSTVRALPGRLSAFSVFLCKSILYGVFVWARRALNTLKRRFPARAVNGTFERGSAARLRSAVIGFCRNVFPGGKPFGAHACPDPLNPYLTTVRALRGV